ncbi:MAG: hypothetical protein WKF84_25815 [Pyrinomonadaceae bacterium]
MSSSTMDSTSTLQNLLRRVTESPELERLAAAIRGGARIVSISALGSTPSRALALAALQRATGKRLAVVAEASRDLETWERDVCFWYAALAGASEEQTNREVLLLPASESDPYAAASPHAETLERRALTLWRLSKGEGRLVLLTARALARRTVSPQQIENAGAVLLRDEDYAPERLVKQLVAAGYRREDPVGAIGEFSLRGGILDVWSPGSEWPVRIEFFGDTVDSLREFDPETQRSTAQLTQAEIAPMRELVVTSDDLGLWADEARSRWSEARYVRSLADRTVYADEGETFPGWEWLIPLVHRTESSVFDYLHETVMVIDEPGVIENSLSKMYEALAARYAEIESADDIGLRPEEIYLTPDELRIALGDWQRIELRALGRAAGSIDESFSLEAEQPSVQLGRSTRQLAAPLFLFSAVEDATEIEWISTAARRYHGLVADLARDVQRAHSERGVSTLFAMPSLGVAERIVEMLGEYAVGASLTLAETPKAQAEVLSPALVAVGRLSAGFEMPGSGLIVHIENDVFDEASDNTLERRGQHATAWKKSGEKSAAPRRLLFFPIFVILKSTTLSSTLTTASRASAVCRRLICRDAKASLCCSTTPTTRSFMCRSNAWTWYSATPAQRDMSLSLSDWAAWAGSRQRLRPGARCAIWPMSCCACMRRESWLADSLSRAILRGSANLKRLLNTRRRPIRKRPSKTLSTTCRSTRLWIACCAATSVMAKPKSRCVLLLRR